MKLISTILVGTMLVAFGCAHKTTKVEKMVDPHYPNRGTHTVIVDRVMLSDTDFHKSTVGQPLDVQAELLENGKKINPSSETDEFNGTRGERNLEKPIKWVVSFDPDKNYQIVVKEQAVIADASKWMIPQTPKMGYWPVTDGNIQLGSDSYIHISDTKVAP